MQHCSFSIEVLRPYGINLRKNNTSRPLSNQALMVAQAVGLSTKSVLPVGNPTYRRMVLYIFLHFPPVVQQLLLRYTIFFGNAMFFILYFVLYFYKPAINSFKSGYCSAYFSLSMLLFVPAKTTFTDVPSVPVISNA